MWIVQLALRRKLTFIVVAMLVALFGVVTIVRTPTDIFPNIDVPVVTVIWGFGGLPPKEMEGRMITICERAMTTTVNDIEHIESQIYPGIGLIKVYFQPGANPQAGVAQVTAINQTLLRIMPPGTTPPLILQYSASSVPILQVGLSSQTLTQTQVFDFGTNFLRTQLATVQGASIPLPYGGASRQIMVDLDIPALQAKGLSPADVINAVSAENLIAPGGTVKIGAREYNVVTNEQPETIEAFNDIPVKTINGAVVKMRDVAFVHEGHAVQTNLVTQNGQPGVLMTVLKSGNASTIDVVDRIKTALKAAQATVPAGVHVEQMFDQSVFVKASVQGVIKEAVVAACLTALMILLFLGSWRSTLVVATSIPLSILTSIILLGALGQTINIMTLGGLALAVGILVDDATVEVENTNRNLAMGGRTLTRAILDGANQIAVPTFVATTCICIVFVPVVFLTGAAKSLFTPLAMAVVFAMMSSYFWSRTLVPVMVQFFMRKDVDRIVAEESGERIRCPEMPNPDPKADGDHYVADASHGADHGSEVNGAGHETNGSAHNGHDGHDGHAKEVPLPRGIDGLIWRIHHAFNHQFESFRERYCGMLTWALNHRPFTIGVFIVFFLASFCLAPFIGEDFFPNVDAGQITMHIQGPSGMRLEETAHLFHRVENEVRRIIPKEELKNVLCNIGLPSSGINLAFSNSATLGTLDGDMMIALNEDHHSTQGYVDKLRDDLSARFPEASFFFEPADITTQILNFGLPAPIDIQVTGRDPGNVALTREIERQVRRIPGAVDVHMHQVTDAPELDIVIDRERAQALGLQQKDVVNNLLTSLVGTGQVTPSYFLDPKTGVSYSVVAQTPQRSVSSISDLQNTPIIPSSTAAGSQINSVSQPQLLGNIATIRRGAAPQIVDHYNVQPTYDVYASVSGRDLGGVASDINKILDKMHSHLPKGTTIVVRGQVQSMNSSFLGLGLGMIMAVALVYLLMVVNFQSWLDPLIIITALPGALSGILWMLFVTRTTFNVPSLMGAIMSIGVATSNSILLITFANERRHAGDSALVAAQSAGFTRLRPVLMTALALILGMLPMALGLGEGGEQNAPLGRAVIGGSTVATFSTLFFVPVVYSILRRKRTPIDEELVEIERFVKDEETLRQEQQDAAVAESLRLAERNRI
jgi:multidrug efflux pump subunit AcrB